MIMLMTILAFIVLVLMYLFFVRWLTESDWYFYMSRRGQIIVMIACGAALGCYSLVYWLIALVH